MKKCFALLGIYLFNCIVIQAQTKVFKEVSDEISSQIQPIRQDNSLIGYIVFTQLEKASADSFNYKITIMDENLNDIGVVNFREENLKLEAVSFEQDIICIGYLKSNLIDKDFKNKKSFKEAEGKEHAQILTQFLNLEGKIVKQNKTNVDVDFNLYGTIGSRQTSYGKLDQSIQISNISQKGFAFFYGDFGNNYLTVYDLKGNEVWNKKVTRECKFYYLLTSHDNIYLLRKWVSQKVEGGYEIIGYNFSSDQKYEDYMLKDKKGNWLKVLGFDNDPISGNPYVTGMIINSAMDGIYTVKDVTRGPYVGVFTINLNGPKISDYQSVYSYWTLNANSEFTERGRVNENNTYSLLDQGFKDYNGNTYFVGSSMIRRTKWGAIGASAVLTPFLIGPAILAFTGTTKCKFTDAAILKQNSKGSLSYYATVPCNEGRFWQGRVMISAGAPQKSFYRVTNSNTKQDFVIVDDVKDIVIYNVSKNKVVKTISHKDGSIRTNIYPAKEGYIMVSEFNKKEKYTRFSIESL